MKEVLGGGRKRCRRHPGVFGLQMRCFGHVVKGVFGGRKGVFEAKRGVWERKGVFGGVMGSVPEGLFESLESRFKNEYDE